MCYQVLSTSFSRLWLSAWNCWIALSWPDLMMSNMKHSSVIVVSWPPTYCLSTEVQQNVCPATLLSNISLTIPFIPRAEPPTLPLITVIAEPANHNLLNTHVMITQPNHVVPECHSPSYSIWVFFGNDMGTVSHSGDIVQLACRDFPDISLTYGTWNPVTRMGTAVAGAP